jgi:ketosteroid isomerase-like protein
MPVQSIEILRQLGHLDREMIEHRVRAIMEMRAAGRVDLIGEYLSPDIVCQTRGRWAATLFPRPVVGKAAVLTAMHQININYQNIDTEIHELVIDGDRVALHRTTSGRNRGSGRPYKFDIVSFFRFREGLVTELCEYFDAVMHEELEDL